MLRGRCRTQTHLYDDPHHPDRVTRVVESPAWTDDDRALLLALQAYEDSLCPGCQLPKAHVWHSELDGACEGERFVCHGCTARRDDDRQAVYTAVRILEPFNDPDRLAALPPLVIGVNTTPPADT